MTRSAASTVVVKVGSSSLTTPAGEISSVALTTLMEQLIAIRERGFRPILVSSGAIASGRGALDAANVDAGAARFNSGVASGNLALDELQALAAVGQGLLVARYADLASSRGAMVGQVLVTPRDFGDRASYLNARATLMRLLAWDVIPVVNENDTTATDEISFGENDRLAALVATLVHAELLLILTDTAGVYTADPRLYAEASLIEEVAAVDADLEAAAGASASLLGSGGMASKVAAAKLASWGGITTVIAAASEPDVVARAAAGEAVGTRVLGRAHPLPARKLWIAFARPARGRLTLDAGAVTALREHGRSLLPVGIASVSGDFRAGEAVEIADSSGAVFAKGVCSLAAAQLVPGAVRAAGVEAVHRDDLVLLAE